MCQQYARGLSGYCSLGRVRDARVEVFKEYAETKQEESTCNGAGKDNSANAFPVSSNTPEHIASSLHCWLYKISLHAQNSHPTCDWRISSIDRICWNRNIEKGRSDHWLKAVVLGVSWLLAYAIYGKGNRREWLIAELATHVRKLTQMGDQISLPHLTSKLRMCLPHKVAKICLTFRLRALYRRSDCGSVIEDRCDFTKRDMSI